MTTIAYKDGVIACDTQITQDDTRILCPTKITIITKSLIVAGSGDTNEILRLEKFFRDYPDWEAHLDKKPRVQKSVDAILISKGVAYTIWRDGYPDPLGHPFIACGSGWKFAMAGMHLGLSAPDAVKLASEFDVNTNDRIKYLNVAELQGSPKAKAKGRGAKATALVPKEKAGAGPTDS